MKSAVVLMVLAVLLATSLVHESEAFAAGGGAFGKKRTLSQVKTYLNFNVHFKVNVTSRHVTMKNLKNIYSFSLTRVLFPSDKVQTR